MTEENGWKAAKELILYRLNELAKQSSGIEESVAGIRHEIATFKEELLEKVGCLASIDNESNMTGKASKMIKIGQGGEVKILR